MTILGLDPGLANTGWGVIESDDGRLRHTAHGFIQTHSGDRLDYRLNQIYSEVAQVIEKFRPQYAGIESLYFAKNVKSAIPVAQARGVLLLLMNQNHILSAEVTPIQIKQSVTGKGRSEKGEVQAMVKLLLGLSEIPKPDHAADALAAAIAFDMNKEVFIGKLNV